MMRFFTALGFFALAGCGTSLDLLPADGGDGGALDGACVVDGCACGLTMCNGACVDLANDPNHCGSCPNGCAHSAYCAAGSCTCRPTYTACGSSCVQLASDPDRCGGCAATPCTAGQKCEASGCHSGACTGGLTGCDVGGRLACVDLASGIPYCGACGVVCAPDEVCAAGKCARYAPATPCTSCPCVGCTALVGSTTCCPGIAGGSAPICVAAATCP